ncbi:MAG TPA: hypothetical protein VHA75_10545, partial [Rugosimonospora sp.]|nr:hypothetical protein [Rugosimonospora sp.]
MRHLGSLLLSLVLTAAWYVVLGLGLSQFTKHALDVRLVDKLVLALAFLVAGVLYGLTVLLRLSPVGLVISGLALAVLGFWSLFDIGGEGPFTILPTGIGGFHNSLVLPVDYAAFAAIPLLLTVFSPRRWRRYATPQAAPLNPPVPVPGAAPAGGYPPPGAYGSPAASSPYGTPVSVPPADPYGSPVSPAGAPAGPEGTRLLPGAGSGSG